MHTTYAITRHKIDIKPFRCHELHDTTTGVRYVVHWPRSLQEQLRFEAVPELLHLPYVEDQRAELTPEMVALMPVEAGITTSHNTYQALLRLHRHYRWSNFHPHA